MGYNNGTNALRQLLMLRKYGACITKLPEKILTITNGLAYYFVEVTCNDGGTYVIEAYGEEAMELARETAATATIRKEEEELVITT